ncbi:MAG: DNA-processing protein DprA [Chloroflexi bacterium]|nr:DNA-processing protein DprA [Chloroflexota bacterium]
MDVIRLDQRAADYPTHLSICLGRDAPPSLAALGNLGALRHKKLALFCSVKCPGDLILQTYDLAQRLRHAGICVVGGFHSPMERECLHVLLRGPQPIIQCPARGMDRMRLPADYKAPLEAGRLLLLSPFDAKHRRATVEAAITRNRFVAALADTILVAHAAPSSKLEDLCREVLGWGKPLLTLENERNQHLVAMGAVPVRPETSGEWL